MGAGIACTIVATLDLEHGPSIAKLCVQCWKGRRIHVFGADGFVLLPTLAGLFLVAPVYRVATLVLVL